MKTIFCLVLLLSGFKINAQIAVDQNDMPSSGDTIYYGISAVPLFDPAQTDTNYIWDFSNLVVITHRSDTFLTVFQTPAVYNIVFNPLVANLAYINQNPPTFGVGITITEYYDFLKKSSSYYHKAGFGAMINGVPTPVKYDNPEIYYSFPLNYNNQDSSVSSFGMTIPGYGYFGQTIKHQYIVDGWGTLIIHYGTFQVLRVKATINITDTVYLDTIGYGYTINRPTSYEYYWIAKNLQGQALKISQTGISYSAEFLDSLAYSNVSSNYFNEDIKVFPNPANTEITVHNISEKFPVMVTITDNFGKCVFKKEINQNFVNIDVSEIPSGFYLLKINSAQNSKVKKLVLIH